jgi:hypothetical protein
LPRKPKKLKIKIKKKKKRERDSINKAGAMFRLSTAKFNISNSNLKKNKDKIKPN